MAKRPMYFAIILDFFKGYQLYHVFSYCFDDLRVLVVILYFNHRFIFTVDLFLNNHIFFLIILDIIHLLILVFLNFLNLTQLLLFSLIKIESTSSVFIAINRLREIDFTARFGVGSRLSYNLRLFVLFLLF